MNKLILFASAMLIFMISSCKKETPATATESNTTTNTGSGSGGNGTPAGGGAGTQPFGANFTISASDPDNIFENQPIVLISKAGNVVSYLWKIDNTTKILEKSPTIVFPYHGLHKVSLTVTDDKGNTASSSMDIMILCNFLGGTH